MADEEAFRREGAEALPLDASPDREAASPGVTDIVIGPDASGRLNLMANVFGEPLVELLAKFQGAHPSPFALGRGGYSLSSGVRSDMATAAGPVSVVVVPNPSHLEAVNPVALGRVRARQHEAGRKADGAGKVLGIILHTDASVIAQGCVAELIQLSGLEAYATGGTIHVVVNNQIGFTTERHEARTSLYCTGAWKAVDSAILHVNGNDPDAVIRAADLTFDFRQEHRRDAVVDLVCYRRNGHNEIDEPRFTQPLLYRAIDRGDPRAGPLRKKLDRRRHRRRRRNAADLAARHRARLQDAYAAATDHRPNRSRPSRRPWVPMTPLAAVSTEPETAVRRGSSGRVPR